MNVQNMDRWNLLGYDKQKYHQQLPRMANHPKMKNAKRDTISFSTEGLEALHGQKLHGAVDVEEMKRIDNQKHADSRKTDECCISEEGKTALEEKMLEAHDNTLLHVAGRLSNISRQYYVDLFGKTLQATKKSKNMDEFFLKMESLHEEMEKEIESKYDNLQEEEYFVSQNGTIEKLIEEKELDMLHFAYKSHRTLMENSMKIWEKNT